MTTSFLSELKRRSVIRMAGLYLVGAWLVVQVAGTLLPIFGAPGWMLRTLVLVLALLFLPALIFSWVFELTPEGLKRDADVGPEATSPRARRRTERTIIVVLTLALMYFGVDRFVLARSRAEPGTSRAASSGEGEAAAPPVSPKSIAVLPFSDLSPGHDQEYFSDGMAEEILNALAQVRDLKVAGRTSSFYFKGRSEDLRAIGRALGVATVLEGSVRKQAQRVRVTAQLIRVSDDTHLWSHEYDGTLADVFQLQEDIARAITGQLQVILGDEQKTRLVPVATTSPDAYALDLQATAIFDRRDAAHYPEAVSKLQQAIRLDPGYARAYARLASLIGSQVAFAYLDEHESQEAVARYARRASELDPGLAEPYAALGMSDMRVPGRLLASRAAFERALKLDPADVNTNFWFGLTLIMTGYERRGIALFDRALQLDPLLPNLLRWRGIMFFYGDDLGRAEQLMNRARDLGLKRAEFNLAFLAHARGDADAAVRLATSGSRLVFPGMQPGMPRALAESIYGNASAHARGLALIDAYLATPRDHISGEVPADLARMGEPARALAAFPSHLTDDDTDFLALLWSPQGRAMRALPEFGAFLRDFGFIDLWEKYGAPDGCTRTAPGQYRCD